MYCCNGDHTVYRNSFLSNMLAGTHIDVILVHSLFRPTDGELIGELN